MEETPTTVDIVRLPIEPKPNAAQLHNAHKYAHVAINGMPIDYRHLLDATIDAKAGTVTLVLRPTTIVMR